MNTDELREYVKDLPEEIKGKFVKKEFLNQRLEIKESLEDFFSQSRSVAEVIKHLSKFDETAQLEVKSEIDFGYYEGEEQAQLEVTVTEYRNETDDELTGRIFSKIKKVEKELLKEKEKAAKDLVRKNIKPL